MTLAFGDIKAAIEVLNEIRCFCLDVKVADADFRKIADDVKIVSAVLTQLKKEAEDVITTAGPELSNRDKAEFLQMIDGHTEGLADAIRTLRDKLKEFKTSSLFQRAKFALAKKDFEDLRQQVDRQS